MSIDYHIFYTCSHFLSVSERKSRNNSFSIFKRLFSYLNSCNVFAAFLPRCLGICSLRLFNPHQSCIAARLILYSLCKDQTEHPSSNLFLISFFMLSGYFFIPFFPDITKPPMIVLFYHRRCRFSIVRFYWFCSNTNRSRFCFI